MCARNTGLYRGSVFKVLGSILLPAVGERKKAGEEGKVGGCKYFQSTVHRNLRLLQHMGII